MLDCVCYIRTCLLRLFFFFFFSSRRRHTRCGRDWSSDVCSSDLFLLLDARARKTQPLAVLRYLRMHHLCTRDRKSTRLNSSHVRISYAVFCLKKKNHRRMSIFIGDSTERISTSPSHLRSSTHPTC